MVSEVVPLLHENDREFKRDVFKRLISQQICKQFSTSWTWPERIVQAKTKEDTERLAELITDLGLGAEFLPNIKDTYPIEILLKRQFYQFLASIKRN